jgi:FrmR/RcnR family transcriptional regulator, repressor of rcnA expression
LQHTIRQKTKLINRARRIRGQVEALERALEAEVGCAEVLQQIAAVRGAISALMGEVLEDQIVAHVQSGRYDIRQLIGDCSRLRNCSLLPVAALSLGSAR